MAGKSVGSNSGSKQSKIYLLIASANLQRLCRILVGGVVDVSEI